MRELEQEILFSSSVVRVRPSGELQTVHKKYCENVLVLSLLNSLQGLIVSCLFVLLFVHLFGLTVTHLLALM